MSSPTSHKVNTEWHTPVKTRVRTLFHDAEMPKAKIAKKLEISRSTVRDILAVNFQRRPPTTRQRPPVLSDFDVDMMVKEVTKNYETRILTWSALVAAIDREDVCGETVRARMHERGFKKCKACRHPFVGKIAVTKRMH